jgi:hypothetical protein
MSATQQMFYLRDSSNNWDSESQTIKQTARMVIEWGWCWCTKLREEMTSRHNKESKVDQAKQIVST